MQNTADANRQSEQQELGPGLAKLRRRRWFLWMVLALYLPTMWGAQRIIGSFNGAMPVFFGWVGVLVLATAVSAVAKCPRCGNYYHVNGMVLLYLRKCLHCQLPINADRNPSPPSPSP